MNKTCERNRGTLWTAIDDGLVLQYLGEATEQNGFDDKEYKLRLEALSRALGRSEGAVQSRYSLMAEKRQEAVRYAIEPIEDF